MFIPVQGGDADSGKTHFNKTGSKIPAGQVYMKERDTSGVLRQIVDLNVKLYLDVWRPRYAYIIVCTASS